MFRSITALVAILIIPFLSVAKDVLKPGKGKYNLNKNGLLFTENKGQVKDQNGNSRNDIDFKVSAGNGLNIFIGNGQLHYQWNNNIKSQKLKENLPDKPLAINDSGLRTETYRMDVKLLGANKNVIVETEERQNYYENYFLSGFGKKASTAHTYKKITYKNVYPNIDWVLYINNTSISNTSLTPSLFSREGAEGGRVGEGRGEALEYDFIIHPGGHVSDIKLKYEGAADMQLNADGSLTAITPMGAINEKSPSTFEKESGAKINSSFILKDGTVGFNTDDYSGTLIIDPTLAWCTYFGGNGLDWGEGVACDGSGNVFMDGYTTSSSNIATAGSYLSTYSASNYTFLAKFDPFGGIIWATYYYGDNYGTGWWGGNRAACDPSGNVYITGAVNNTVSGLATTNAYQTTNAGGSDAYLAKFDGSGNVLWATYFGGSSNDYGSGVACDAAGNVFMSGWTESTSGIATTGAYQTSLIGTWNSFVVKFNSSGSRQWSTYYGGSCSSSSWYGAGIACDGSGNVFISGWTCATSNIATTSAYQTSLAGASDAYLAKFNGSGAIQWATYYGGSSNEWGGGVACNSNGDVYMTGYTYSTSGIATAGAYQTSLAGNYDAFLVKFSGSGSRLWATYYGGSNYDYGSDIVCNSSGSVFMVGLTESLSGIATASAYQTSLGGSEDGFLAEFDASGNMQYATYYGGPSYDQLHGVACDPYNNIFMCGLTYSTSGIATSGAYQTTFGGGTYDAFLGKWGSDSFFVMGHTFDTVYCAGDTLHLSFQTGLGFQSGNVFEAQLSDAYGNFANPVTIGTDTSVLSGNIACTIPANTAAGNHYHFRIISTNPVDSSLTDTTNIRIKAKPFFTVAANTPVCEGRTLQFTTTNAFSPVTYHWTGPNGFGSLSANPSRNNAVMADSGYYYATDTLYGCISADTILVAVLSSPASIAASANTPCVGDTLKLNASSASASVNYTWTGPGAYYTNAQNPVMPNATAGLSGTYHAIFSLSNGCADTTNVPVTVSPIKGPPVVNVSASPDTFCAGANVTLSAIATNAGSPSYQWRRNGININGATSPVFTTSNVANGDHITCKVTSNSPC